MLRNHARPDLCLHACMPTPQIGVWRSGLVNRFRWSSVLGFTLGLMLGLSTLIQTAASFQRAVRNATTLRVMRRLFGRVGVGADGAAAGGTAGMGVGAGSRRHGGGVASMVSVEDSLLANRAMKTSVSLVVFFFGVLMSTAVIQLYMVSSGCTQNTCQRRKHTCTCTGGLMLPEKGGGGTRTGMRAGMQT